MFLMVMFGFILLALLVFISPGYVAFFFFVAICVILLWMIRQKEIAYALILIFGMSTVSHLLDYVDNVKNTQTEKQNQIDSRIDKINSIVDKVYGTAKILDSEEDNGGYIQNGANSLHEKLFGTQPKVLKGDEKDDKWFGN